MFTKLELLTLQDMTFRHNEIQGHIYRFYILRDFSCGIGFFFNIMGVGCMANNSLFCTLQELVTATPYSSDTSKATWNKVFTMFWEADKGSETFHCPSWINPKRKIRVARNTLT
jgi:hypothetical protein